MEAATLRTFIVILALALLFPGAARAHEDPYYVQADLHPPRAPSPEDGATDCSVQGEEKAPATLLGSLDYTLRQVWPDGEFNGSVADLAPTCVVLDTGSLDCAPLVCHAFMPRSATGLQARFTYNVTGGDYTLESGPTGWLGGDSGIGLAFDCQACPPPSIV